MVTEQMVDNKSLKTPKAATIETLDRVSNRLVNTLLVAFSIFAVPVLAASLFRAKTIGWQPVFMLHIGLACCFWGVTLFRKRLSLRQRSLFFIGTDVLLGPGGLVNFGLIGQGVVFLLANSMLAAASVTGQGLAETLLHILIGYTDEGDVWQFSVADNGPGIAGQDQERIFRIFQTVRPDEDESTGIGLAIVKKIVESAYGKVWVESTVGQGSTFFFTWPKGDF